MTGNSLNEGEKLRKLLQQFPEDKKYDILFVNDGSTDSTEQFLKENKCLFISHKSNQGVGAGIRTATDYAQKNEYEVIVIMAGNGKMLPNEIDRLTSPLVTGQADYVQGSRYLAGGTSQHLPLFRNVPLLFQHL